MTDEDAAQRLTLSASDADGDPLSYAIVDGPAHGTLAPVEGGGAERTYTPDPDFYGEDRFTYRASDGALISAPATVTVTVREVNDGPTAADDSRSITGRAVTIPEGALTANDSAGPPNESSQALAVTQVMETEATHGQLEPGSGW